MKRMLLFMLAIGCAQAMDQAVHSIDDGKKLGEYWNQLKGFYIDNVELKEAHALYDFIEKAVQDDAGILMVTPQQLAKSSLPKMYRILYGVALPYDVLIYSNARELCIEETGRSIEALLNYLIETKRRAN